MCKLIFQNVLVTEEFQELQDKLEKDRILTVTHGGIAGELYNIQSITFDPLHDFRKNPVGMLRDIAKEAGYRMIDLFKDFDKDGNSYISKDEFVMGIKVIFKNTAENFIFYTFVLLIGAHSNLL